MHQSFSKKVFHICMVISILVIMLFIFGMIALRYEVEGETNLPFNISKIIIISTVTGEEKENPDYTWAYDILQNNDIYISLEKNSGYNDTEVIEDITLTNFSLITKPQKGNMAILKPNPETGSLFNMSDYNIVEEISYEGTLNTNIKNLQIGNQGGIILFRYANTNLGEYISNDGDTITHDSSLLQKIDVVKEELYATLSFEMQITLKSAKKYQATIELEMPIDELSEKGKGSIEINDLSDIVFKRIS